jgi:hypothetical protein
MMFWHKHRWVATGAYPMLMHTILAGQQITHPITEVLLVCDCGHLKTVTLDGTWALEQLQPAPSKAEADDEFFRKLGVKP